MSELRLCIATCFCKVPYVDLLYLGASSQTLFLKKQKNTEPECYRINRFTDRERKEIFDAWRKHIKSIPTEKEYMDRLVERKKKRKYREKTAV